MMIKASVGSDRQHRIQSTAEGDAKEVVIEAADLTRRFGETIAVAGLNLTVHTGEILGLVGPDGAGKTTTLRLLNGIMDPTSGRVTLFGHDPARGAFQIRRRLGYMAQRFTLYEDLTVLENLTFFADVYGIYGERRRGQIERLLGFSQLAEFKGRRAGQLSGGMQKKLALACALIHEPDLLLLDEPTTGVDPVSRREFWDMLAELHVGGMTMVVCTPYMDEAEHCSRVGLMYAGQLLACDTPARIKGSITSELLAVWPTDVRQARDLLRRLEIVREVQTFGDQLRVFVRDAEAAQPRLIEALEAAGIAVRDVRPARVRMEEAFISLIRQRQARNHVGAEDDAFAQSGG
jgi:ABC-2 type transport system ATP-binding protein